ncbi:hypothetical protein BDQ12DRAFT_668834 [Crucibulum laeve]|uniref:Uncharacterized protein n=1 Tax=Crucibulum laeve TaxID=68775 RepID=A0A5C3LQ07_9AGAR|nr:hypothetical protein BDQ12DRAFT_668834 [Crucibulum laeve]
MGVPLSSSCTAMLPFWLVKSGISSNGRARSIDSIRVGSTKFTQRKVESKIDVVKYRPPWKPSSGQTKHPDLRDTQPRTRGPGRQYEEAHTNLTSCFVWTVEPSASASWIVRGIKLSSTRIHATLKRVHHTGVETFEVTPKGSVQRLCVEVQSS